MSELHSTDDFVVITLESLRLALPATELLEIQERQKISRHQEGLWVTAFGAWQLPVYSLDANLLLQQNPQDDAAYCVVFAGSERQPAWGITCSDIARFSRRQLDQQQSGEPQLIPSMVSRADSPLTSVLIERQEASVENWIFTTTTEALTQYIERCISDERQPSSIDMAC